MDLAISKISMDTYFYDIWRFVGPHLRLVKPRLKICTFVDFLEIEFEIGFRYLFERQAWTPIFMRFGVILARVQGWSN